MIKSTGLFLGAVVLILALIIAGPLLLIWSLNTLFGLGIDYTIWTWLAAFILAAIVSPTVRVKKS